MAKTWATKCCPGTYKNNYQLCCGIKGKYKQFVNNCFDTCPRQALHAMTLGFVHPVTGEEMHFTSELPDDMTRLIEKWRGYISNRDLE